MVRGRVGLPLVNAELYQFSKEGHDGQVCKEAANGMLAAHYLALSIRNVVRH